MCVPDRPERWAFMERAENLPVAFAPLEVHRHNLAFDVVKPWAQSNRRRPFMNDLRRSLDPGPLR